MPASPPETAEILIVAGEASSSLYAQRLLQHWNGQGRKVRAYGIGSRSMEREGFKCLAYSEQMAIVGLFEVLRHLPRIRQVFRNILDEVDRRKTRVALLLDYPDFNLRLAKELKKRGVTVIYYISPQIWAWRTSRVHLIRKVVDRMLVVLPFEKEFYQRFGVNVEFVGHPLLDEIAPELYDAAERARARSRFGLGSNDILVGLMPGSRRSEIDRHLALQLETARRLNARDASLKFALLVAPSFEADDLRPWLAHVDIPMILLKDDPLKMVNLCDVLLCASGTATLTVGLMHKPLVIMYRMNWLTGWLARLFVRHTRFFGLINLVLGKKVAPELFQGEANVDRLADEVGRLAADAGLRQSIESELAKTNSVLGDRGATSRVARVLEPYLEGQGQ